jgi:hypothetical protein
MRLSRPTHDLGGFVGFESRRIPAARSAFLPQTSMIAMISQRCSSGGSLSRRRRQGFLDYVEAIATARRRDQRCVVRCFSLVSSHYEKSLFVVRYVLRHLMKGRTSDEERFISPDTLIV